MIAVVAFLLLRDDEEDPSITGTPEVLQVLEASAGNWFDDDAEVGFQWERCDDAGETCTAIEGGAADLPGQRGRRGCNASGRRHRHRRGDSETKTSGATDVVTAPPPEEVTVPDVVNLAPPTRRDALRDGWPRP